MIKSRGKILVVSYILSFLLKKFLKLSNSIFSFLSSAFATSHQGMAFGNVIQCVHSILRILDGDFSECDCPNRLADDFVVEELRFFVGGQSFDDLLESEVLELTTLGFLDDTFGNVDPELLSGFSQREIRDAWLSTDVCFDECADGEQG
jgi:hypothetical protein